MSRSSYEGPAEGTVRVVAFGGGHGLHATLSALRAVTPHVTAVVTVGDDGGSSGRIRRELGLIPPGDLRMALCALADGDEGHREWVALLQHRFSGTGALAGHAVGNLILSGLTEQLRDPVRALDVVAALVGVRGRVLPMSPEPVDLVADVRGLDAHDPQAVVAVRGQVAVATTPGRVVSVHLIPSRPRATPQAVEVIRAADWVVLGPGSWFTSVIPNLLVPELAAALQECAARRLVVLNLVPQPGETAGFSPVQHLDALSAHAPELRLDVVLADPRAAAPLGVLRRAVESRGCRLVTAPMTRDSAVDRHDPSLLAAALGRIMLGIGSGDHAVRSVR